MTLVDLKNRDTRINYEHYFLKLINQIILLMIILISINFKIKKYLS